VTEALDVIYLDHVSLESGAELALARLLPALQAVEAKVVLATEGPLVERLQREGVAVEVLPMTERARDLRRGAVRPGRQAVQAAIDTGRYCFRLARYLRRVRPDLVVTNSLKADLYGGVAARLAGIPVIWHVHDRIAADYLPGPAVTLVRLAARLLPSGIVANSRTTLATVRRGGGRPATVIGNACPLAERPAAPERRRPLTIGMVGRLAPWKGQDVFLRAFASAFAGTDTRGVVVGGALFGEDEFAGQLHRLAGELGVADQVRFTGHLADPWPEMATWDILVHASVVPEPFGQVVVEGMALGLCVVASDSGGPAEIITDGRDGRLFPTGNEAALSRLLGSLAADPVERARLATAGPAAAKRFSAPAVAAEERAFYEQVLAGRRADED